MTLLTLCLPSLLTKFEGLDLSLKLGWGGFRLRDAISRKQGKIELIR